MKRIAILVIAATTKPLYVHYIKTYWSALIEHTNAQNPNIDVFLLFETSENAQGFEHLRDNIIIDGQTERNQYYDVQIPKSGNAQGILSKTIYAFKQLQNEYDVFFRTNLSSMVNLTELEKIANSEKPIIYSGGMIWADCLRQHMMHNKKVGPDKSIKSIDELAHYKSNTFISGCGYLLGSKQVDYLIANENDIRYDLSDDIAVGLMLADYEHLPNFTLILRNDMSIATMVDKLLNQQYVHVRLQHFPLEKAQALWQEI